MRFYILYVYVEILPTIVRSRRVGGKATHPVVPQIFFGILAATGGFLVLLLPETNNRSVPDTLEDMAEISRKGHSEKKNGTDLPLQEMGVKDLQE
ncbi:hypothetical protein NPIL_203201 [Nephila pilipes]|uniref:Uncharacterized protein n=1 Tax=Nephila pilipes TaxID=299642 RepID=A0A8X6UNW4_NEPPI|nr:hypothetical protein NPIL_203201 [Nephila pilipes]